MRERSCFQFGASCFSQAYELSLLKAFKTATSFGVTLVLACWLCIFFNMLVKIFWFHLNITWFQAFKTATSFGLTLVLACWLCIFLTCLSKYFSFIKLLQSLQTTFSPSLAMSYRRGPFSSFCHQVSIIKAYVPSSQSSKGQQPFSIIHVFESDLLGFFLVFFFPYNDVYPGGPEKIVYSMGMASVVFSSHFFCSFVDVSENAKNYCLFLYLTPVVCSVWYLTSFSITY